MGQITFTGLASGLDTSSWIEALVSIKQQSVTTLQNKQSTIEKSKSVLDTVKSSVSNLRSAVEKLTDAKFGGSFDLFAKNTVSTSDSNVVAAMVTSSAARQSLDVVVNRLATTTTATSTLDTKINKDTLFTSLASGNAKAGTLSVYLNGERKEINIDEEDTLGKIIDKFGKIGVKAEIDEKGIFRVSTKNKDTDVVIGSVSDDTNFASVLGLVKVSPYNIGNSVDFYNNYTSGNYLKDIMDKGDSLFDMFGDKVLGTIKFSVDGKESEFEIKKDTTLKDVMSYYENQGGFKAYINDDGHLFVDAQNRRVHFGYDDESNFIKKVIGGFNENSNGKIEEYYTSGNEVEKYLDKNLYDIFGSSVLGGIKFSVDGKEYKYDIKDGTSLKDVMSFFMNDGSFKASFNENGQLYLYNGNQTFKYGYDDESDLWKALGGLKYNPEYIKPEPDYEFVQYESYNPVNAFDTSSKLVDVLGKKVAGTFTIGNQEFTIDSETTMKSLIGNINSKSDAGVEAYWDASAGSLVLKAKTEGSFYINIEAGTSDFTDIFGFTSTKRENVIERKEENYTKEYVDELKTHDKVESEKGYDKITSTIVQGTQKLGDYAMLSINGANIISSSNTVTSDISGIDGLTLSLKSVSKKNDNGEIESTSISISHDTDNLVDALKSFISSYNKTIDTIDSKTSKGEALYGDTSLSSLKNNLRNSAMNVNADSDLKLLANIGITTGSASNSLDTSSVNKLQLDEEKFKKMLDENPDAVKALLLGDNKGNNNSGGILNKLEKVTEDSLDASSGYFERKSKSLSAQVNTLKSSINSTKLRVDAYRQRLQKQFNAMEQAIASMQQNYSKFAI